MMKHTPGKWKAEHSGTGDCRVTAYVGWKHKDGTEFNPIIVNRIDWPTGNLISAAPELLEALKCTVEFLERDGNWPSAVAFAKAAITKATGGVK